MVKPMNNHNTAGVDLDKLCADIKHMTKLADDVGRSRQSNNYAMNSGAVEKLVDLEASVLDRVAALARRAEPSVASVDERERRWEGKLDAVWSDLRAMVEKHTGNPCEGEPLDALDELLSARAALSQQEASHAANADEDIERLNYIANNAVRGATYQGVTSVNVIVYSHELVTGGLRYAIDRMREREKSTAQEKKP